MTPQAITDIFSAIELGAPLFVETTITASGKLGLVLDRRDLDDPDGDLVGFGVFVSAVAAADPANTMKIVLHEAGGKTDTITLDASAAPVNVGTGINGEGSGSDSDVLGFTANGVRNVIPNPAFDATQTVTTQTEPENLQNGVFPLINDTGQAGTLFFFSYRGYKDCLQLFAEEVGTASITATAFPVFASCRTRNLVNPATPA